MTENHSELIVEAGVIVALRLFDMAYAIDLVAAEAAWRKSTQSAISRSQLSGSPAKAIAFDVPPVLLTLEPVTLQLEGRAVAAQVTARLYDFGVVALALRIPIEGRSWSQFNELIEAVNQNVGASATTSIWEKLLKHVRSALASTMTRPTTSAIQEDYLLGIVHRWNEPLTATELQERVDLIPMLSGDRRQLSDGARRDLMRQRFSYYEDDLVVLTWDRAFIYEPRGDSDVADVLEVANAQLLELRYYDELLDDELPRMNDLVDETRGTIGVLAPRRFAHLARRLYTLVSEVTEITEKVDNALQVTEDVYLARIYSAALELFRVPNVSAAVDRKLSIIRDTYTALYDESSGARGELMEFAIVILIVAEIVLALIRH
jgi:hypothetical protein